MKSVFLRAFVLGSTFSLLTLWGTFFFWRKPQPNIILLSMDTVRADQLSYYGYAKETSPVVHALLEQGGIVFQNNYVDSNYTLPSHLTIFTGQPAFVHKVASFNDWFNAKSYPPYFSLSQRFKTMAEHFRSLGYKTTGFWTILDPHLAPSLGFSRGFDEIYPIGLHSEEDAFIINQWINKNKEKPFFLFLHQKLSHDPYLLRKKYSQTLSSNYKGSIPSSQEEFVTKMNEYLKQSGLREEIFDKLFADFSLGKDQRKIWIEETKARTYFYNNRIFWHFVKNNKADMDRLRELYDNTIRHNDTMLGLLVENLKRR